MPTPSSPAAFAAWHNEVIGKSLFLYFDSDKDTVLHGVVNRLRSAGVFVPWWGPSKAKASNGRLYSHAVQIACRNGEDLPDMAAVRAAVPDLKYAGPDPGELDRLRTELEQARREASQAAAELEATRRKYQTAAAELNSTRLQAHNRLRLLSSVTAERDRLGKEVESLQSFNRQALAKNGEADGARQLADRLATENQSLRDRIKTQADEWVEAYSKWEEATAEMGQAKALAEALAAQLESEQTRQSWGIVADAPDAAEILRSLLPNLHVVDEALGYLLRGIEDRGQVLRLLSKLNIDHARIRHKSTKCLPLAAGWTERHFSTGRKDDGRLYYSRPVGGRRLVVIAPKVNEKAQDRLVRRLNDLLHRFEDGE